MCCYGDAQAASRSVWGGGGDDNKYGGEEQDGRDGSVPAAVAWAGGAGKSPPSPGASVSRGGLARSGVQETEPFCQGKGREAPPLPRRALR